MLGKNINVSRAKRMLSLILGIAMILGMSPVIPTTVLADAPLMGIRDDLSSDAVGTSFYVKNIITGGTAPTSIENPVRIKLTDPHPLIELLENDAKKITAVSGARVSDLKNQLEPENPQRTYEFKVVDWLGDEKTSWLERPAAAADNLLTKRLDMLTTSDRLIVTDTQTGDAAEYEIEVPGEVPYWNGDKYNEILQTVRQNLPVFKDDTFDITDAKYSHLLRSSNTDYTLVFREAIAECTANGGGTVLVPAREEPYRTGAIQLDDNVNLKVEEGATIDFLNSITGEFYPGSLVTFEGIDYYGFSAPIYAYDKENIAITGGGTIKFTNTGNWDGNVDNTIRHWNFANTPINMRNAFGLNQKIAVSLVQFNRCSNIIISDVTFGNSPFWSLNPVLCENVLLRGTTITSVSNNSDGFNPESCKNVIIENNVFANKDDNIALKSGRTNNGKLRGQAAENIIIRNNIFWQGSGISVGSESSGGVNNIYVENNFWNGLSEDKTGPMEMKSGNIFRVKMANCLDAVIEDIYYRNIAVGGIRECIFFIERVNDNEMWYQTAEIANYGSMKNVPTIRNIAMSNIFSVANRATGAVDSTFQQNFIESEIQDLRPVDGLYFKDIDVKTSKITTGRYLTINNTKNLVMENVRINDTIYNTEKTITISDVKINDTTLDEATTTTVTSRGDDGTLVITGRVDTDIDSFETVGSVRISYDIDSNYALATLSREGNEVRFTATLTGVGADLHDLAVVAKSNRVPHYVVDNTLNNRKSADIPYHDVETYKVDVEGTLRSMNVRFEYDPPLTRFHNAPVFVHGNSADVRAVITDAKTGVAVTGATIKAISQTNFNVAVDGYNVKISSKNASASVRNHIAITITCPGFASKEHIFRRVLSLPTATALGAITPLELVPMPTSTPRPSSTPKPTSTPTATPVPTTTPTATPVPTTVPTATPIPTLSPTNTPSPTTDTTATPVPTTEPTSMPTDTPVPTETSTPTPHRKKGDVNGDGKIALSDAQMALRAALNIASLSEEDFGAADVNGDGLIKLNDAQTILRAALNIIEISASSKKSYSMPMRQR